MKYTYHWMMIRHVTRCRHWMIAENTSPKKEEGIEQPWTFHEFRVLLTVVSESFHSEFRSGDNQVLRLGNSSLHAAQAEAGSHEAQTEQELHITFPESKSMHEVATSPTSTTACSPRSPLIIRGHRPSDLKLTKTNGLTKIPIPELKQQICDGHTNSCATITQVSHRRPKRLPKTPIVMGNKPSSVTGSPAPGGDDSSMRSVVRNPGLDLA